jgi:hypothetical protein
MRRSGNISLLKEIETQMQSENLQQVQSQEPWHKPVHIHCQFEFTPSIHLLTLQSDVLRRRFQINTMSGMGYQYKSISDAIITIVRQEGFRGLYKGIVPNLLKVAPSMASSWLSFEMTRDFLIGVGESES